MGAAEAQTRAAQGRLLVEALVFCLSRSKVGGAFDPETLRSVVASSLSEIWRDGEIRLESLWKTLCQQAELTAEEIAPPLFIFKSCEDQLGVRVRLPHALSAIPRAEQDRLRDALPFKRTELVQSLGEIRKDTEDEPSQAAIDLGALARRAEEGVLQAGDRSSEDSEERSHFSKGELAIGFLVTIMVASGLGSGLHVAFHNGAHLVDVADVATILRLSEAKLDGPSMVATLDDPRWEKLSKEEQRKLSRSLFDLEEKKGVQSLTLIDKSRDTRAIIYHTEHGTLTSVP